MVITVKGFRAYPGKDEGAMKRNVLKGNSVSTISRQDIWHKAFMAFLTASLLIAFSILAGCVPLRDEKINTELFKDKEDMKTRTAQLRIGMSEDQVFKALNIPKELFEQMSTEQIQLAVYGHSEVQGTPEQLEKFKRVILSYEGYSLPYRSIDSTGSLGFGKINVKKQGYDLRMVLVFEGGKLLKSGVEGRPTVNENENESMWTNILKTGVKAAF